jgi:hypothetical protein
VEEVAAGNPEPGGNADAATAGNRTRQNKENGWTGDKEKTEHHSGVGQQSADIDHRGPPKI